MQNRCIQAPVRHADFVRFSKENYRAELDETFLRYYIETKFVDVQKT